MTLVDVNPEHIAAINASGLELDTRAGVETLKLPALRPEKPGEPSDLVVLFTKTFHTDTALDGVKAVIGPETHVLTLQNGLGNAEAVARHVPRERVIAGVSTLPRTSSAPVACAATARAARRSTRRSGATRLLPNGWPTGYGGRVADHAGTRHPGGDLVEGDLQRGDEHAVRPHPPHARLPRRARRSQALIRAVVLEGVAAANANGIAIEAQPILDLTVVSVTDHADHEASMLQDVKAGRRTEVDAINGAIVRAARAAGVAVPVTETLWRLVKLEEAKLA